MEIALRAALLDWLAADPAIADACNVLAEEAPSEARPPWLGITASASADWSTKTRAGAEVRVALELQTRGDDPATALALVQAIDARALALAETTDARVVSAHFLRSRSAARPRHLRAHLREYRFRLLAKHIGDQP